MNARNRRWEGWRYPGCLNDSGCSNTFCGKIARFPRLTVENLSNFQLFKIRRELLARRTAGGKQQMETTFANITHVSWLNPFEVGMRGRFPDDHMHSGEIREGKPRNKPQSVPKPQLRHLPMIGQRQAWIGTLLELTCGIYPSVIVPWASGE